MRAVLSSRRKSIPFRVIYNINFHDEEVVDFAQDLFSKDPIDEETEIVDVCGSDAKSQMLPSFYENVQLETYYAQFERVYKAPRTDSDATSDFRRDHIFAKRFSFAILNEIRDAVNNGREPIVVIVGLDDWTCNAERLRHLFKTHHKRYGSLNLIVSELKSNQSYNAGKNICTGDGGLLSSPHVYAKSSSLRYVGHNGGIRNDVIMGRLLEYMADKRVWVTQSSEYRQSHGARRTRRNRGSGRTRGEEDGQEGEEGDDDEQEVD